MEHALGLRNRRNPQRRERHYSRTSFGGCRERKDTVLRPIFSTRIFTCLRSPPLPSTVQASFLPLLPFAASHASKTHDSNTTSHAASQAPSKMSSPIPPQAHQPSETLTPQKSSTQPTSPTRPKHLTTRSITEISSGHGHKHHHHPHIHRHLRKNPSGDLGAGGSGGSGNEQGSRSEGVTPSGSRPGSVLSGTAGNQQLEIDGIMGGFSNGKGKAIVTQEEVREEKERAVLRATFVPHSPHPNIFICFRHH